MFWIAYVIIAFLTGGAFYEYASTYGNLGNKKMLLGSIIGVIILAFMCSLWKGFDELTTFFLALVVPGFISALVIIFFGAENLFHR